MFEAVHNFTGSLVQTNILRDLFSRNILYFSLPLRSFQRSRQLYLNKLQLLWKEESLLLHSLFFRFVRLKTGWGTSQWIKQLVATSNATSSNVPFPPHRPMRTSRKGRPCFESSYSRLNSWTSCHLTCYKVAQSCIHFWFLFVELNDLDNKKAFQ